MDDDNYDRDRYDSAAGWDGSDSGRSRRTKKNAPLFPDLGSSPFRNTTGSENWSLTGSKPSLELFGSLWRAGETAILFGDAGIGKSVLALQIAESIARGSKSGANPFPCTAKPQPVVYIDFERSREQFGERYSAPSPIPGKLPVKHRLPQNLIRAHFDGVDEIPDVFKREPHRFFLYWTYEEIQESGASVAIIDNIAYLARTLSGGCGTSAIKALRNWAVGLNLSILAVAHRRPRKPHCILTLADIAAATSVAALADSVFAIGGSTCGPDIRYIKHLKSRSTLLTHAADNVAVYQVGRMPSPRHSRKLITDNLFESSSLTTTNSQPPFNSPFSTVHFPFLGLHHLGFSDESVHLTDHIKKAQLADRLEREQLRRSKNVVNSLMSREYKRYLER